MGIHGITLLITVAVMAGSCIAVPMGSPSSSYGGYSYQTTTAAPYYTTTYAAPSYYTTKAPEYYPTTYAAPTYYTEAPMYTRFHKYVGSTEKYLYARLQ
ncbi:hypothetical protein OUZ56_011448 [Daphnia magna]|uniref:Uncharacterized protein n=1 Tax=Daphnia magna TaxID=35525 RepID=A0ABQ9Z0E4_9CRUS|nr:hypothetical protein OUZ56_011448 [Daphnia magna]